MNPIEQIPQVNFIPFNELPVIELQQLQQLADYTKTLFGHGAKGWYSTFQAITYLRSINKQVPQHIGALFDIFGTNLVESFEDVKPIIQKNAINLLTEIFQFGQNIQIQHLILQTFVPKLIYKSQTSEQKTIKQECLTAISMLVMNCAAQDSVIEVVARLAADLGRPILVQKFTLQVMAKILEQKHLRSYQPKTLTLIMQVLQHVIQMGKGEIETSAVLITQYLYNMIGDAEFRTWMTNCLPQDQIVMMVNTIQVNLNKKTKSKCQSQVSLSNMKELIHTKISKQENTFSSSIMTSCNVLIF
ncbi:hypothetical protein pb186bvf_014520 [Paramecium bursaria]